MKLAVGVLTVSMKREKRSALGIIRKASGMTVREFGAAIGVSDAMVVHMEHGKRIISPAVATAIMAATGADSDALRQGKARCLRGRPYTAQSLRDWREVGGTDKVVATVADRAAEMVRALVLASASGADGQRTPGRFKAVSLKLSMALEELATGARLIDAANLHLSERITQHERRLVPVEEAKRLFGRSASWPEIAKGIGKAQTVEICETTAPVWTRFSGRVQFADGSVGYGEACVMDRVTGTVRLPGSSARPMKVAPIFRPQLQLLMRAD